MPLSSVTLKMDRLRRLRYGLNAMADLEEAMNMGFIKVFDLDMSGFRVMRAMVWAGLHWEDRSLTLERTGDLMEQYLEDGGDWKELTSKVTEAMSQAGWLKKIGKGVGEVQGNSERGPPA